MTKQQAKEISLELWKYLSEHPDVGSKFLVPEKLWNKISGCVSFCPLCEVLTCNVCPLSNCGFYNKWEKSKTNKTRKKYATKIYEKILNWNIN